MFARVQDFSAREVGRFGTPSLITRTTNDVQQVQMLAVLAFTLLASAPIMCVGGIILALNQNVQLSSLLLVAVPALGVIVSLIISRMRPQFRVMQVRIDNISRVLREQITGVRVVRAFVRDEQERERFESANADLFGVSLSVGRLIAFMFPSVMLVLNLSSIAVLWFGGHLVAGRRHADRRADRVPELPAADPDVGHDGHVRVHDVAPGRGLRRADHGGAGHRGRPGPARRAGHRPGAATATWSCAGPSSATRGPRSRCCATSAWSPGPARSRRSSAAPAAARPRCSA